MISVSQVVMRRIDNCNEWKIVSIIVYIRINSKFLTIYQFQLSTVIETGYSGQYECYDTNDHRISAHSI